MAESITVPDRWPIETTIGRYADTDFHFTYAAASSQSLEVMLRGAESSPDSVIYTLSVRSSCSEDQVVFRTTDEDTAMAGTEFLLRRLQQSIQQEQLSEAPTEDELEPVINRTARRFTQSPIGRFLSLLRFPSRLA